MQALRLGTSRCRARTTCYICTTGKSCVDVASVPRKPQSLRNIVSQQYRRDREHLTSRRSLVAVSQRRHSVSQRYRSRHFQVSQRSYLGSAQFIVYRSHESFSGLVEVSQWSPNSLVEAPQQLRLVVVLSQKSHKGAVMTVCHANIFEAQR